MKIMPAKGTRPKFIKISHRTFQGFYGSILKVDVSGQNAIYGRKFSFVKVLSGFEYIPFSNCYQLTPIVGGAPIADLACFNIIPYHRHSSIT